MFQESFKGVLCKFKVVSRVFYRCFMDISCFLGYLKVVLFLTVCFIEFTRFSKEVLRVFKRNVKGVSRGFQG